MPPTKSGTSAAFTAIKSELLIGHGDFGAKAGEPHKIDLEAIPKHVLACGTTGSGKSVCLKVVAESLLARGIPIVALDVMGDLAGLAIPAGSPDVYKQFHLPEPLGIGPEEWALGKTVADRLSRKIHARYLTPCSDIGERLAISPLPLRPRNFAEQLRTDRDEMELLASAAAWSLMGKIGLRQPKDGAGGEPELVRGLIYEVILAMWQESIDMEGLSGIERFLELAKASFDKRMPINQQAKFEVGLMSLATGQAARWLEGTRLDWDDLLAVPPGRTPLIIVALEHLPKEQHPWIVSQVVSSLASWCSIQPPTPGRPRIALLIDELAGEGGRNALLPKLTYNSSSGTAIRHVLRKGRHWGLGLLAGTQAPSDIDGRSFNFFNTLFAGKLKTDYDVRLALSGGTMSTERLKKVSGVIKTAVAPKMFYQTPNGWCESIRVRWLGTLHSRIERQHIPGLYAAGYFHRPSQSTPVARWRFQDDSLLDASGRVVIALLRQQGTLLVATVDAQGAGMNHESFPCTIEGLLRCALWMVQRAGTRGPVMAVRTADDQRHLVEMALTADVSVPWTDHGWYQVSSPGSTTIVDLVGAIHQGVIAHGHLPCLPPCIPSAA